MPNFQHYINNFTAGEVSPQIEARTDLQKHDGSCRKIMNGIVMVQGGITKRPGTKFVAEAVADGILIPFVYSPEETFVLLFTDKLISIYSRGGTVVDEEGNPVTVETKYEFKDVANIKFAQVADVMYLTHKGYPPMKLSRYSNTDWRLEDVEFAPGIDAPEALTATVSDSLKPADADAKWELEYKVAAVNAKGEESLPSEAVTAKVKYSWPSGGYVRLRWNPIPGAVSYEIYKNKFGWFAWAGTTEDCEFKDKNIEPDDDTGPKSYRDPFHAPDTPDKITYSGGTSDADGTIYKMRVSTISFGGAESVASPEVSGTTFISATVTVGEVAHADIYRVYIRNDSWKEGQWNYYDGIRDINSDVTKDPDYMIVVNTGKQITKSQRYNYDEESTAPNGKKCFVWQKADSSTDFPATLYTYRKDPKKDTSLYQLVNGKFKKLTTAKVNTLRFKANVVIQLDGLEPQNSGLRPTDNETGNFPGAVGVYQQRLMFGGTDNNPQTMWLSETGSFNSMAVTEPLRDDSAITVTVDTKQRNEIRHFITLNDMFVLTNATEFKMTEKDGLVTPGGIGFRPQSYWGSSHVPPIVIGKTLLLLDVTGRVVRDVHYNLQDDGYSSDDRGVLATHLLRYPVVDWAYQQTPFSTVYMVRDDGKLLTFTFMREQEVWAWAQHESAGGKFKSVCCVRERDKNGRIGDHVYFLMEREVLGKTRYYIEEQVLREFEDDVRDAWFVDSGLDMTGDTETTYVNKLDHLAGCTVNCIADGTGVNNLVVDNAGGVNLPFPAKNIIIGLPYTMEIVTCDAAINSQEGSKFGARRTIGPVYLDILETAELQVGSDEKHLEQLKFPVLSGDPELYLYSGQIHSPTPGFARDVARIMIRANGPLPATVLAIRAEVKVE